MPGGGLVSSLQLAADPWDESFKLSLEGFVDMSRANPGGDIANQAVCAQVVSASPSRCLVSE